MNNNIFTLLICLALTSCGAVRTFHDYARAGDTVAIPVGTQPTFNKDSITVTITPDGGIPITLAATDPAIHAVVNFYPDPISHMIVSREIEESTAPGAETYSATTLIMANNDKDYFQTTVLVDLPLSLPVGLTHINIADSTGISHNATLDIIPGTGSSNSFQANVTGSNQSFPLDSGMLDTLSRSAHTEVSFSSSTIPHAIEINFTHDPDKTIGGNGKAFIVNPLGYLKNLSWNDDGVNLKIIMIPSTITAISDMNDYKFYIAGTVTNLQHVSTNGYDIDGNPVANITSSLTVRN